MDEREILEKVLEFFEDHEWIKGRARFFSGKMFSRVKHPSPRSLPGGMAIRGFPRNSWNG